MNFVFLTYALTPENWYLMPWRYLWEVSLGILAAGHKATIISAGNHFLENEFPNPSPSIIQVGGVLARDNALLVQCIEELQPDVIYFPIARRSAIKAEGILSPAVPHVAYFPSAWYDPRIVCRVLKGIPFKDAMRFFIESLIPGRILVNKLKREKVSAIATLTDYTAAKIIASGWPSEKIQTFLPGREIIDQKAVISGVYSKYQKDCGGKKIILFMGPPKTIRGIYFLFESFERAVKELDDVMLVCLMRHDKQSEWHSVRKVVDNLNCKNKVIVVEDRLSRDDLDCFMRACRAVALPFMLVPSEIPLAVIDTLAHGKPVLITETGGTSDFVDKAGVVVFPNDVDAMSRAITKICQDEEAYMTMVTEAKSIIAKQPTWYSVSQEYIDFTKKILGDS